VTLLLSRSANGSQTAIVLDGETSISELIRELYGDELTVRRNLGAIVLKEFFLLSITIVGMLIVILTLSGDMQKIAAVLSILGFLGHFLSLRLFRGRK